MATSLAELGFEIAEVARIVSGATALYQGVGPDSNVQALLSQDPETRKLALDNLKQLSACVQLATVAIARLRRGLAELNPADRAELEADAGYARWIASIDHCEAQTKLRREELAIFDEWT